MIGRFVDFVTRIVTSQVTLNIIAAVLIFFIGKWLAGLAANFAEKLMKKAKVDKTLVSFTKGLIYFGLMVLVVLATVGRLGIQTASFIAIMGAAGLAIGMALQGSLSNFASGVLLIVFRPFNVGDSIEAGGAAGVVEEIQIFNTILKTADKKIILPNSKITGDKITVLLGK